MRAGRASWLPLPLGLLVVALLVALTPDPGADHRVTWVAGRLGTPVELPDYSVLAADPRVVRGMSVFGEELVPVGAVVVAVDLTFSLHRGESTDPQVELLAGGRWYAERSENPAQTSAVEPGWSSVGTAVFVVPPDRLRGASLRVTAEGRDPTVHTVGARVDLGFDDPAPLLARAEREPLLELVPTEPVVG